MKRKIFFIECEECDFAVGFKYNNETFFFCKEHKFGVNVPEEQLNRKYICKSCNREMERYDLDIEDNVCPICERGILILCYTMKELFNEVKNKTTV